MEYRSLGRTGMQVSPLCLGAMMFGAGANPTTTRRSRSSTPRWTPASTSSTPPTSTRRASRRSSSARRWPAAGATTSSWPPSSTARWASRRRADRHQGRPEPARQLPALDHPRGREQPAPAEHRLDRPLPGAPARPGHRHRGDARRAHRPAAAGQDPRVRLVDVSGAPDRRGAVGRRAARARPVRHRAAAVLAAGPGHRGRRAAGGQQYGMGVLPWSPLAGGWLTGGYRKGQDAPESTAPQPDAGPLRPVQPGQPAQARRRRRTRRSWPTRPGSR